MTISFGADFPTLTLTVNFSGSTWTDISDYVRSVDTNRPSSEETGLFPIGSATIVLDNRDGRFTPANLSGPYVAAGVSQVLPEIGVRLKATWAATDYNLFCGIVEDWHDEFPEVGKDAVTVLTVVDYLAEVAAWNGTDPTEVGAGERTLDRIERIIAETDNASTIAAAGDGDETLQAQALLGNGLDLLHQVVASEGGAILYDPIGGADGSIRFISRSGRVSLSAYSTVQTTFSAGSVGFRDPVVSSNRGKIVRSAAFTRIGGVEQVSGSGTPRVPRTDLLNETDAGVAAVADLAVAIGDPADNYRVRGLTVDPVNGASWASVLDLGMVHLCRATVVPPGGDTIDRYVHVDGISHSIRYRQWSVSFEFSSATAWVGFSYGEWDSAEWDVDAWFF